MGSKYVKSQDLRLAEMERMRLEGHTLEAIASEFGITRERVRQVLLKSDKNLDTSYLKELNFKKKLENIYEYVVANWDDVQAMNFASLASLLNVDEITVREALSPLQAAFLLANDDVNVSKKFTDEDCIKALQIAQTYIFPLSGKSYSKLVASGDVIGPSVPLILKRFGTWTDACKIAGVEAGETVRPTYEQVFTDNQLLLFVRRFMFEQSDANWSIQRYSDWRESNSPEAPSVALLRNRLGGWASIRVQALRLDTSEYNMFRFAKARFYDK